MGTLGLGQFIIGILLLFLVFGDVSKVTNSLKLKNINKKKDRKKGS